MGLVVATATLRPRTSTSRKVGKGAPVTSTSRVSRCRMPTTALIAVMISSTTGADLKSWCHPPLGRGDNRDHDGRMSRIALSAQRMPLRYLAHEEVNGHNCACLLIARCVAASHVEGRDDTPCDADLLGGLRDRHGDRRRTRSRRVGCLDGRSRGTDMRLHGNGGGQFLCCVKACASVCVCVFCFY